MDTQSFWQKGYVQVLMALALVGVVAALAAYTYLTMKQAGGVYTGEASISVTGEGEILAKPDIGTFSFSVRAEGSDAAAAQEASAESINAILGYLEEAGVEEVDVKTRNYNLNPTYRWEEQICPPGTFCPRGEQVIDGYEVNQSVTVKVREIDEAGNLISGVGERGATNISSLQFTIDDEDDLMMQAKEAAIADAKEKAKELADNLGMKLGKITGYWEEDGGHYKPVTRMATMEIAEDSFSGAVAPSIPTGENTVTARVTISYELR